MVQSKRLGLIFMPIDFNFEAHTFTLRSQDIEKIIYFRSIFIRDAQIIVILIYNFNFLET